MFNKKGQAALEFLTTYGWAFLVILVMTGALSYFGVLSPGKYITDSCKLSGLVECGGGFAVEANETSMRAGLDIANNNNKKINVTGIKIKEKQDTAYITLGLDGGNVEISSNGEVKSVQGDYFDSSALAEYVGEKKVFDIIVEYTVAGSTIGSSSSGQITTTVAQI